MSLNRRRELTNKCLHKEPFKLSNFYSHHLQQAQLVGQHGHLTSILGQWTKMSGLCVQLVHQDVRPVQLVQDDVQVDHTEDHVLVVDQDEQLVQPGDHVHDALAVSDNPAHTQPPDQGLPIRSSVVDQNTQLLLVDQEE
jgi:hypothetical protein